MNRKVVVIGALMIVLVIGLAFLLYHILRVEPKPKDFAEVFINPEPMTEEQVSELYNSTGCQEIGAELIYPNCRDIQAGLVYPNNSGYSEPREQLDLPGYVCVESDWTGQCIRWAYNGTRHHSGGGGSSSPEYPVPEFGGLTAVLALIGGAGAFAYLRRR